MANVTYAIYWHNYLGKRMKTRYLLTAEEAAKRLVDPELVPGTEEIRQIKSVDSWSERLRAGETYPDSKADYPGQGRKPENEA